MSLEMSPSPSELASEPPLINSELGTYPPWPPSLNKREVQRLC